MAATETDPTAAPRSGAVRWFGRMQLLRLLGKSELTMAWRVADPRSGQELLLVLPRVQPADAVALEQWQLAVRKASRLNHPALASVVEIGAQDGWPYVAYDPRQSSTLAELGGNQGMPDAQAAALAVQALQGLAFAHDAGVAHHDLQPYHVLVEENGQLRLAGTAVAAEMVSSRLGMVASASDTLTLRSHREAAERDVLSLGVVLHLLLAGAKALDESDVGRILQRLPPLGREIVRLPWTTAHPIAEPLRAIVNRATDRRERQRYHNARTLLRALEGWLQSDANSGGGPLALLADRLRSAGVLPSMPGGAARAARMALMEGERTNELAQIALQDLALSFELLRMVNTAQVRGALVAGSGPVLTVRRAIAMVGLDGVRHAALALREWPGPLQESGAGQLQALIDRCKRAGRIAVALRPAGYDGEVVYLVTLLQNLGRLVVHYHFAEEALQIRRLMQPSPQAREGETPEPGMTEEAAAYAVLGIDIEAIGAAVARQWGLEDSVLAMVRRMPLATTVHASETDGELLRMVASCANEAVDALALPAPRILAGLQRVAQRYGRALGLSLRDIQDALQEQPPSADAAPQRVALAPTAPEPMQAAVDAGRGVEAVAPSGART